MTVQVLKSAFPRESAPQLARGGERLPIRMEIGGRSHLVSDLGKSGTAVVEYDGKAEMGQILQATLTVALDGFDIVLPAQWEVIGRNAELAKLDLMLAMMNPPTTTARVTTVIDAILDGSLVGSTDVMEIAARRPEADPLPADRLSLPRRIDHALRRRVGAVAFLLLAALLLAFIAANVASRALVVQADGTVVTPGVAVARAPADAQLIAYSVPTGTRVRAGQPVAVLKTPAGLTTLASSCDCVVATQIAAANTMVRGGEPIVQLIPAAGTSTALVSVPRESLRRVRVGDEVTASFYDNSAKLLGTVERVSPPKVVTAGAVQQAGANGTVEVRFARPLPAWRVGEPVMARILLSRFNPFA